MSAISQFNIAISRTQEQRRDVRAIISHATSANHPCPLLANGYCRTCPAYIGQRHGEFYLITQTTIAFNYEREYLRASQVARNMLLPFAHIPRTGIPAPTRTRIQDIHPPTENTTHVCPPCPRQHLDQHTCPACTEPHLRDHTCPVPTATIDEENVPEDETETETSQGNPNLPTNVWNEIQNIVRQSQNAPAGTPFSRLRNAITAAQLTPQQVLAGLRPTTTVTTNTVYVPVPCSREHADTAQPCQLEHVPQADPSLPVPPRSVLLDPTVAQTQVSVTSYIIGLQTDRDTRVGNFATPHAIRILQHLLASRQPNDHRINDSPAHAAQGLVRAIRWSMLMHRAEEIAALPHAEPCLYHPCICSFFFEYVQDHQIPETNFVWPEPFLRSFLSLYAAHLRSHGYTPAFVEQVQTPLEILGRFPATVDALRPFTGPFTNTPIGHQHATASITLPRLRFDYEDDDVPDADISVRLRYRA